MTSYARGRRLLLLALACATLLLVACTAARSQSPTQTPTPTATPTPTVCSFGAQSGAYLGYYRYISGTALTASGVGSHSVNRLITFPTATGCTTPVYTLVQWWERSTSASIPGLTLDGTATPPTLTGTPSAPNGFRDIHWVRLRVTDSDGDMDDVGYGIEVEGDSTPAFAESLYTMTFYVDRTDFRQLPWPGGNTSAFTFSSSSGYAFSCAVESTPPCLTFDSSTAFPVGSGSVGLHRFAKGGGVGIIAGGVFGAATSDPPTEALTAYDHTITFTDADGDTATTTLRLGVEAASEPEFYRDSVEIPWTLNSTPPLSNGDTSLKLDGAGGPGTTYALTGTLPAGISFTASTRTISGRPTETGTFTLTLTATDTNMASDTQTVVIKVWPHASPALRTTIDQAANSATSTWFTATATSCKSVDITWPGLGEGSFGNQETGSSAPTLPAATAYHVEGKQRGVENAAWQRLATTDADDRSHTHAVPVGSAWSYRVRAATASGNTDWTYEAHVSTTVSSRWWTTYLTVGQTLALTSVTGNHRPAQTFEWHRSPDQADLAWTHVTAAGSDGFYDITAADVGQLLAVVIPSIQSLWDQVIWDSGTTIDWPPLPLWESSWTDPYDTSALWERIGNDRVPVFADSSLRIDPQTMGSTVNVQLPAVARASDGGFSGDRARVYELSPALPDGLTFNADDRTITGTPAADWNSGAYTLTARDADCDEATLALNVAPQQYTLTTTATPSAGGTVTGGGDYTAGTSATVTATPNSGYRFDRWTDACTGSGACSVSMTEARSVTAHFVRTYTLTTSADPSAGGTVSAGGAHDSGDTATVTATPNSGYRFDRWTGACTGSGACSVTMNADRSVTAHFVRTYTLTTSADPSAGGTISAGGTHDSGDTATVTATPNSGYRFDRWSGDCTGSGTCSVTMSADRSVTAHFVRTYTLTTTADPSAGGTVSAGGTHDSGDTATVTATPNSGYRFDRWSGACTGSGACSVTMSADRSVTAHFELVSTPTPTPAPSNPQIGGGGGGGGLGGGGGGGGGGFGGGGGGGSTTPTSLAHMTLTARVAGNAPDGVSYRFRSICTEPFGTSLSEIFRLRHRESHRFPLWAANPCSLELIAVSDAYTVSGEGASVPPTTAAACVLALDVDTGDLYEDRRFAEGEYTTRITFTYPSDPAPAVIRLTRGFTFVTWPGEDRVAVGEALGDAAGAVTAVYYWNAAAQRWLSWFPGGDAIGVNTLRTLRSGGIYAISAARAPAWHVDVDAAAAADAAMPPAVVRLSRGFTFVTWRGERVSVGEALGGARAVTAVYAWDAAAQRWLSWFPGGDAIGVNTLRTLQPGGIYAISAATASSWRIAPDDAAEDDDEEEDDEEEDDERTC